MKAWGFCLNTAKSFVGKRVNLHLRDGVVVVNVLVRGVGFSRGRRVLRYGGGVVPLSQVAFADEVTVWKEGAV